jgi:hypothetical protein
MLSNYSTTHTREKTQCLHPSTWQATGLWQTFLQNVDNFNKVLHIPTAQVPVFTAINDPLRANAAVNALLFSIYFGAVISMTPDEVASILGQDKTSALDRFKLGLERSLVQSNFLEAPGLTALQALALFLVRPSPRLRFSSLLRLPFLLWWEIFCPPC